jgi:hypothetical protein
MERRLVHHNNSLFIADASFLCCNFSARSRASNFHIFDAVGIVRSSIGVFSSLNSLLRVQSIVSLEQIANITKSVLNKDIAWKGV